ncbi:MAG: hypothetical protein H6626_14895 [Pseudobdellovibrionaceae bacterium]|nr:hypothetical protein [Bdellovibrionales bacterium]USN47446.1 MAG: hypothetical protein H6626_14895 [Pseudobdellovibrionaceae bacterium]
MNYDGLIEQFMQHFTSEAYRGEVKLGRAEFHKMAGVFDEESPDFEEKMSQFVDWYLFARPLSETGRTPVEEAHAQPKNLPFAVDSAVLQKLVDNRPSLFEFIKLKGSDLSIKDMFSGYKYTVKDSPLVVGLEKNVVFSARLIPIEDGVVFSGAFCFHPIQANKFIRAEVKAVQKLPLEQQKTAREKLLAKLFSMRHKFDQYRHVEVKDIYSNDSRVRL